MRDLLIGLGPRARIGKDFAANTVSECYGPQNVRRVGFADALKYDINDLLFDKASFDVFTEDSESKEVIRPLLVAYGEFMRSQNPNYWIERALATAKRFSRRITVISDCRYPNEVEAVQKAGGKFIYIDADVPYVNDSERMNAPLLKQKADAEVFNGFDAKFPIEIVKTVNAFLEGLKPS